MVSSETADLLMWALAAVGIAGVLLAVLYPRLSGNTEAERIQSVTASRSKKVAARSAAEVTATRKKAVTETLKEIDHRKKKTTEKASLRTRLQQAGIDAEPREYFIASGVLGAACAIGVYFSLPPTLGPPGLALALITGFVGALGLPGWILSWLIKRRQMKFIANLANAIDVVVRGVKTGLPLNECLGIIARESPEPIRSEFREVVDQQRLGVTMGEALERLVSRVPLPEVKFLAIVISIQQSSGGNLSEALGNLSQVLRDRFTMKLKVKALSAEALASAMVLGSLPPIVIVLLHLSSPQYLVPLFATKTGNMALMFGGFWMSCGIMMMKKMINFKY